MPSIPTMSLCHESLPVAWNPQFPFWTQSFWILFIVFRKIPLCTKVLPEKPWPTSSNKTPGSSTVQADSPGPDPLPHLHRTTTLHRRRSHRCHRVKATQQGGLLRNEGKDKESQWNLPIKAINLGILLGSTKQNNDFNSLLWWRYQYHFLGN